MKTRSMLFVDDHPVYREGLQRVLAAAMTDLRFIAAVDIASALSTLNTNDEIDLCIADQRLPDGEGVDLLARVRREFPTVAVGILTADVTPALAHLVRQNGGVACLSKARDCQTIVTGIQSLFDGGEAFDCEPTTVKSVLSQRRRDIVRMASVGKPDKQICVHLNITESAVRNHWHHIFNRLDAANRTEAVTKALRLRMI